MTDAWNTCHGFAAHSLSLGAGLGSSLDDGGKIPHLVFDISKH